YKAMVEGVHPGLLYRERVSVPVAIGQKLKGYVRALRPDGKIDLDLDQAGYRRVKPLAEQIIQALERNGGRLDFDDDSSPEAIREAFGVSKKAFKQALGTLYKARRILSANQVSNCGTIPTGHPANHSRSNTSPGQGTPTPKRSERKSCGEGIDSAGKSFFRLAPG
ncbi:MAG TPA: hypothetical protein VEC99_10820, partial [Clostridia bacterium]|nr:hypothetical protein [Clostridia bacterium]